jgi:hypothetical protein
VDTTHGIRALAPRASEASAIAAFERGFWTALAGKALRSVALVHVPFRIFEVDIVNRGRARHCRMALDAVNGTLDPYEIDGTPERAAFIETNARNILPVRLDAERAREVIVGKMRRVVFQSGFFRVHGLEIRAQRAEPAELYVPYWLGFCGSGAQARIKVMDAVRAQIEGSRARALFEDWLLESPGTRDRAQTVGIPAA